MIIRHKYLILILATVCAISYPIRSYAYDTNKPGAIVSNDRITMNQYNAFITVLGNHLDTDTTGSTPFYDTGIPYENGDDVQRARKALTMLYCGRLSDANASAYENGMHDVRATGIKVEGDHIEVFFHGEYGGNTIKAGWCPGSDPKTSFEQHMQAWNILSEIAQGAPETDVDAYRYFNDELCKRITYGIDADGYSSTPYGALVRGIGQCSAYSKCFYILCFMTGRKCLAVSDGSHARNVVYVDGIPKWVDVTWNDGCGWSKYLLTDLSQQAQDYINLQGTSYRFEQ